MTNQTKHTVSLKLAKQMKKLGWEKETLFWWSKPDDVRWGVEIFKTKEKLIDKLPKRSEMYRNSNFYPAPIASEILESVRSATENNNGGFDLFVADKQWVVEYKNGEGKYLKTIYADTPAEALGKMWVYLKKEKPI